MFKYQENVTVNHNVEKIYNIVANINNYPKFIPWCTKVEHLKIDEEGFNHYRLDVGFGMFNNHFITKDKFTPFSEIEIKLVEGPFKHLYSLWKFEKVDEDHTIVDFNIEFDFKNPFIGAMLGKVFLDANKKILQAFLDQIDKV